MKDSNIKYTSIKYIKEKNYFEFKSYGYNEFPERLEYIKNCTYSYSINDNCLVIEQTHSLNPIKYGKYKFYCLYGEYMSKIDFYLYKIKHEL